MINGTLNGICATEAGLVRPPRSVKELSLAVAAVSEQLTASLDRMPTVDEIGGAGGWVRPEVDEAMLVGTTHRLNDRETLESVHVAEMFGVKTTSSE